MQIYSEGALDPYQRDALVHRLYECVLNPGHWPEATEALRLSFNSACAVAFCVNYDKRTQQTQFLGSSGLDADWQQLYEADFALVDPWNKRFNEIAVGELVVSHEILTARELRQTDYFQGFWGPLGFGPTLGLKVADSSFGVAQVGLPRGASQPIYSDAEQLLLKSLHGHLGRVFELSGQIQASESRADGLKATLDQLQFGVVVLDTGGRAVEANAEAERIVAASADLMLKGSTLDSGSSLWSRQIREGIGRVCGQGLTELGASAMVVSLPPSESLAGVTLLFCPARDSLASTSASSIAGWVVVIEDSSTARPVGPVGDLYGWTPKERRVAELIGLGLSTPEVAERLSIAPSTARTHIKSLISKSPYKRQADLVEYLVSLSGLKLGSSLNS